MSERGREGGERVHCTVIAVSSYLPGYVSHVSEENAPEDSHATPLIAYQVASQ